MWETDTLPTDAVTQLNRSGLVIVPSRWGAACFRDNGVIVPIEVVPLGYDLELFHPAPEPPPANVCTFGTAGALDEGGLRKNVQRAIELFRQAFPTQSDVRLRVKITPRSPRVETHSDPRIDVVDTSLAPAELVDWYRSLHAYVNVSAGEGFGLHLLEAMACGVPLVSTTFSGVSSFFDSRVGYEVGYSLVEANNSIYRGRWADPNARELILALRQVRGDRSRAAQLGKSAALRRARSAGKTPSASSSLC